MEKRDFDDIMLGGEDVRGRDSKKMLLLIIAIVVLVLAIAIIVVAMGNAKGGGETIVVDSPTSADANIPGGGFSSVDIDNSGEDRFDQIVRDIKNSTEPENTTPVPQPEPPKATMPQKPAKVATATRPSGATITSTTRSGTTTRRTMNRLNNGDIAENGYYLQVGAFSKTPNRAFLDNLNNYSYRIQEIMINSNVITRYLVGPYKSREEAQRDYDRVSQDIGKPVYLLVQ